MLEKSQETKTETMVSPNLIDSLSDKDSNALGMDDQSQSLIDTSSPFLPYFLIDDAKWNDPGMQEAVRLTLAEILMPEEVYTLNDMPSEIDEAELNGPIDESTMKALTRDSDVFPPVQGLDGTTTYTVVLTGITDRPGKDTGIDYFRRNVEFTVPSGAESLNDCKYVFNSREIISKEEYDKLLDKAKAANPEVELYAHGVSADDGSADRQALFLQLSNGRQTIGLDWAATPVSSKNPTVALNGYGNDTIAAKRANDNKAFQDAIDKTVEKVGAQNTDLIGFSHGGYFSTRYLNHRVQNHLPALDTVILTHPDVPIMAPELRVNGKSDLFKQAADETYVIGGKHDLSLKVAVMATHCLPGTPTYNFGKTAIRLGNDGFFARRLIEKEGAEAISERNRGGISTHHFLNVAGIRELLNAGDESTKDKQNAFNVATDNSRVSQRDRAIIAANELLDNEKSLLGDEQGLLDYERGLLDNEKQLLEYEQSLLAS